MVDITEKKTLASEYPDVASWCKNYEDALNHSSGSRAYIDWICPYCKTNIPHKSISNIVKDGLSCPMCSDKLSYPQKLMMHILVYIKKNFIHWLEIESEYSPDWCIYKGLSKKEHKGRYDFALKQNGNVFCLIEMDGLYHYIDNQMSGQKAIESDWIDIEKDNLAHKNLGVRPIRIDSRKSELGYIKNHILKSKLSSMFNVWGVNLETDIDWDNCERRSLKNIVKQVCDLYNEGLLALDIEKEMGLSKSGVYNYLKKGANVGLCNYPDGREKMKKAQTTINACSKKIICFNDNKVFKNAREAQEFYPNIPIYNQINTWASRKKKSTVLHPNGNPYDFMYLEDYKKNGYIFNEERIVPDHYKQPVVCVTTKENFENILEAADKYKINKQQIWYNCIGKCNSVGKINGTPLIWLFKKDYNPNINYCYTGNDNRKGIIKKSRKAIICVNTKIEYDCAKTAESETGISNTSINKCVNNKSAFAGMVQDTQEPLVWKWAEEYNENDIVKLPKVHSKQQRFLILENMIILNSLEDITKYLHIGLQNKYLKEVTTHGSGIIKNYTVFSLLNYFELHPEIHDQIAFYREHVYLENEHKQKNGK